MQSFEEFKKDMDWTTVSLSQQELKELYASVDSETYKTMEEIEEEYEETLYCDISLSVVVEALKEVIEKDKQSLAHWLHFYYLKDDGVYTSVWSF